MKKIAAITAVLALLTSVASAEILKNFKVNGGLEVLSITADNAVTFDKNKAPNDKYSETEARVIVGATFDLNDDVSAKVTAVKTNRQYDNTNIETVAQGTIDNFAFFEAYVDLKGVLGMDHRVGKQFYGDQGDMVIYYGPSQWFVRYLGASSLEGWSGVWKNDKLTIGAVSGKNTEGATEEMTDIDLYGLTASYDLGNEYFNPSVYYYQADDRDTVATDQDKLEVIGAKVTGKAMDFGYGFEYAMNNGSKNSTVVNDYNYKGTAMKLNADYGLDAGFGKFKFMGEYVVGSGDKTTGNKDDKAFYPIAADWRPGLIAGGIGTGAFTAIDSVSNITATTLGAKFTPDKWDEKFNLCAKMYNLKYTEAINDGIGSEIDIVATWNHSEDVSLKVAYAMFSPDKDIAIATKDDMVRLMNFNLNVKF